MRCKMVGCQAEDQGKFRWRVPAALAAAATDSATAPPPPPAEEAATPALPPPPAPGLDATRASGGRVGIAADAVDASCAIGGDGLIVGVADAGDVC